MTVLCATDFSPCSLTATELAASLARRFGDRLILLHVVEPLAIPPAAPVGASLWQEGLREAAEARTRQAARDIARDGLEVAPRTLLGPASALILDVARELEARFLVVGTHGRKAPARFFLGSVAEKVARHSRCPVVVTHAGEIPSGWHQEGPLRLAVAVDSTRASHAALSWLGNLAQTHECDVTAVRLYWPPQEAFRPLCPGGPARLRLRASTPDAAEAFAAEAAVLGPDAVVVGVSKGRERWSALSLGAVLRTCSAPVICVPETAAPAGAAAEAILQASRRLEVDLIAVGSRGRSGLRRALLGPAAIEPVR